MLVDANLLLFAVDRDSRFHEAAAKWLAEQLSGVRRVGLPWQVLVAFLRISTHPRAAARPLTPEGAWSFIADWLEVDVAWIPQATDKHASVLRSIVTTYDLRGN